MISSVDSMRTEGLQGRMSKFEDKYIKLVVGLIKIR